MLTTSAFASAAGIARFIAVGPAWTYDERTGDHTVFSFAQGLPGTAQDFEWYRDAFKAYFEGAEMGDEVDPADPEVPPDAARIDAKIQSGLTPQLAAR